MEKALTLTGRSLTIEEVAQVARTGRPVALGAAALARARRSHAALLRRSQTKIIYGVNTGFGPMASRLVGKGDLAQLQLNLIRSHSCGAGEWVADEYVFAAMVVRLNALLRGDSGVSANLLKLLRALLNARIAPLVPEHGGVGASGDLIQLAHIALAVIGEGDVRIRGKKIPASEALKKLRLSPHILGPKEGLALINGTSFMAGVGCLVLTDARRLLRLALASSALALEAAHAFDDCLDPYLHNARPHKGQRKVARLLRALTAGSKLLRRRSSFEASQAPGEETTDLEHSAQDIYSLRCTPQILGPMIENLFESERVLSIEINSATDNPLITAGGRALHGGNFHGEYVAAAMDRVKVALVKLSMLSERRINFFLHSAINRRFPPFLTRRIPGLTLGLQGLQFTAVSTTARNQSLAYPHSVHSIPSNGDNQDVVSMGADAALIAAQVVKQTSVVLAVELAALSQAVATAREEKKLGAQSKILLRSVRRIFPIVGEDRFLSAHIQKLAAALRRGELPMPRF